MTFQSGQCAAVVDYVDSYWAGGPDVSVAIGNSRSEAEAAALNHCTRSDNYSNCRIAQSADGTRASVCISDTGAPASLLSPAAPTNPPTDPEPPGGQGDSFANAINLSVGGQVSGRIDPAGEFDYYRIRASESGTLSVYTSGSLDTLGRLYDSGERQLASNDDGGAGLNFRISREVDAGTYYARVAAYSSSATGSYTVHAELDASTEPEPPEDDTIYGAFAFGIDRDWYNSVDTREPVLDFYRTRDRTLYGIGRSIYAIGKYLFDDWANVWNNGLNRLGSYGFTTQAEVNASVLERCRESRIVGSNPHCEIIARWSSGQCFVMRAATDTINGETYAFEVASRNSARRAYERVGETVVQLCNDVIREAQRTGEYESTREPDCELRVFPDYLYCEVDGRWTNISDE